MAEWWRRLLAWLGGASALSRPTGPRLTGRPTSSNGASSFHLWWDVPAAARRSDEVSVVLEVQQRPEIDDLHFWAVQASFVDEQGVSLGAAHLGLQHHPGHPGRTSVNWGGYHAGGGQLPGTTSELPSARGNVNTRDFAWVARRRYRLTIGPGSAPGAWAGSVTDLETGETTVVRELRAGGVTLASPVVWSEVFAPCDAPPTAVRWSEPVLRVGEVTHSVDRARVSYQERARGGCDTTDVQPDAVGIVQRTGTTRRTPAGVTVPFGAPSTT